MAGLDPQGYDSSGDALAAAEVAWETRILALCREAGLSPAEGELVLLHLQGFNLQQIRRYFKGRFVPQAQDPNGRGRSVDARRTSKLGECLEIALACLAVRVPEWNSAAREFERSLLQCVANRSDYDDRPADLRGVEPDRSSDRFQGARMVGHGDARIRQDLPSAARLWGQASRPTVTGMEAATV